MKGRKVKISLPTLLKAFGLDDAEHKEALNTYMAREKKRRRKEKEKKKEEERKRKQEATESCQFCRGIFTTEGSGMTSAEYLDIAKHWK